jgi:flagellar basal-body rod protein FlgG
MMQGMKMATQGMMSLQQQQEVLSNNLANVGTAGFRKDVMEVSSFSQVLDTQMEQAGYMPVSGGMDIQGMLSVSTHTSNAQGALKMTGSSFDMALDDNGKGFFTVQSGNGIRFTRNGSFRLSTDGYLVSQDGSRVMGNKGPIRLDGKEFQVNDRGVISVNGREVDRFLITEFSDPKFLKKDGTNNFVGQEGFRVSNDFSVKQGYLEMANVNVVKEMVDMMQVMKAFEANQKVLQAQDNVLKKSVNEVGKT